VHARAASYNNPEIIALLSKEFICLAVEINGIDRRKDADAVFLKKVWARAMGHNGAHCVITADGQVLSNIPNAGIGRDTKHMLTEGLKRFQSVQRAALEPVAAKVYAPSRRPEGALVAYVTSKILGGYGDLEGDNLSYPASLVQSRKKTYKNALSSDRLWIRQDEAAALVNGEFPASLQRRIVVAHLHDFTRGWRYAWKPEHVKKAAITLSNGKISGSVLIDMGNSGYQAEVLGVVEAKDGKLTRFDLVAKGLYWVRNISKAEFERDPLHVDVDYFAPSGRYPLAVVFVLADVEKDGDRAEITPAQAFFGGRAWYLQDR
jgi:hypothetical protein